MEQEQGERLHDQEVTASEDFHDDTKARSSRQSVALAEKTKF